MSATVHESNYEDIPLGVASSSRDFDPHPFLVDRSDGVYLHDIDGNRHLDYDMDNGAGLCGHTHSEITADLHDQLDEGTLYTMPHELLGEAASLLKDRWPAVEKVRFTNS